MLPVFNSYGEAGATILLTSTDVAQNLSAAVLTLSGKACRAGILTLEQNDIKVAFGGTIPVAAVGSVGHLLKKNLPLVAFVGTYAISTLKYISAVAGDHATITFTPFY